MIYFCAQKKRRDQVLRSATLNGIDYLEVIGPHTGCGKQLAVTFLKDARALALSLDNVQIVGDTALHAVTIDAATADNPNLITITLNDNGDFSDYTMTLVAGLGLADPLDGLDPPLSSIAFSFKAACPSPADCRTDTCCPSPLKPPPDINYLAKDYTGFLQVMRDRMAVLAPGWTETHAADLGVAMTEALAYAADHLSYQQDAVSTEAYLGTARSRISLRRHARLVDYRIGEGCNARAWVYLEALKDHVLVPMHTAFYVRTFSLPAVVDPNDPRARELRNSTQPVFESMQDAQLFTEQNSMAFYTWGDADCCLPAGATQATLSQNLTTLQVGSVLMFEEVTGPLTGNPADADPNHRWAVRLTAVSWLDYRGQPLIDPLNGWPITRIAWSTDDALPFPLCLSSSVAGSSGSTSVPQVSLARGNLVPVDHGIWYDDEVLGTVPPLSPQADMHAGCDCSTQTIAIATQPAFARFHPELGKTPLTFARAFDAQAAASTFAVGSDATPAAQIRLRSDDGHDWDPSEDLLATPTLDRLFIPEIEYDGNTFLRFGDGQYGKAPDSGLHFTASYRVGNGSVGNVGRDSITHLIFNPALVRLVRNPLAAAGGTDPEGMEHIRQYAPFAFQTQQRCVTEDDYGVMAAQDPAVRLARGTLRWTGSWYTAFVSVEPAKALDKTLIQRTTDRLNRLRMLGTDLAVEAAVMVGLKIELNICVDPEHFRGDVFAALMQRFITGDQCDGQPGLLNASNFTFGQTLFASPLIAAAQAVEGVRTATLTTFTRMDNPWVDGVAQGYIHLGRLEIARCDNDPNHLDRGLFSLRLDGGK
ncbi:putative baseplate assembly protein [Dyella subtropica]|uniref:putative baseplate assembly protein n=1 Tax=Dyella subtropica TaxID=2992127 RepID=UPI00225052C0|nr:putative baseplate assembly protein [Dyella subtropica]